MEWGAGRYERIAEQLLPAAEVVVAEASPAVRLARQTVAEILDQPPASPPFP